MGAVRLSKGQNTTLPSTGWSFFLITNPAGGVDTSALVLGQDGKIRQESDFVFYNQPVHPSGSVRHLGADAATQVDGIEVTCSGLDDGVDRVVIAVSVDAGSIRRYARATLVVRDLATGADAYEVDVAGEGEETALVLAELYRRNGAWKLRAVSQGYDSGLAGLATDYGIEIAEPSPTGPPPPEPSRFEQSSPPPPNEPSVVPQAGARALPTQAPVDPTPPVPDPEEVALVRNLMREYGQACQAITEHIDNAAKVAHDALGARRMTEVRPQHELSIKTFADLATSMERDFSVLYEAFEGARGRARAIGSQILVASSTVKVPFDPEMVLMIVLDEEGTYGFTQLGSHILRREFPASPQAFLEAFDLVRRAIEADDSTILDDGFAGYVVGQPQQTSSSHGVL